MARTLEVIPEHGGIFAVRQGISRVLILMQVEQDDSATITSDVVDDTGYLWWNLPDALARAVGQLRGKEFPCPRVKREKDAIRDAEFEVTAVELVQRTLLIGVGMNQRSVWNVGHHPSAGQMTRKAEITQPRMIRSPGELAHAAAGFLIGPGTNRVAVACGRRFGSGGGHDGVLLDLISTGHTTVEWQRGARGNAPVRFGVLIMVGGNDSGRRKAEVFGIRPRGSENGPVWAISGQSKLEATCTGVKIDYRQIASFPSHAHR